MSLSPQFLDEIRARTTLSALISRTVKLTKSGREHKACCPFHNEKTPSFTVNDDKGFYHCFSCGTHGDAIRWLTDHGGLAFLDAVKDLAGEAGLELPAASPAAAARAARIEGIRPALVACADYFRDQIIANRAVGHYLQDRGISQEMVEYFGLGYAPRAKDYCKHLSIPLDVALAAGLAWQNDGRSGLRFIDRIVVPVHDPRGQIISFGGRAMQTEFGGKSIAKYKNGSDTELFDKGRTLFNLHRALPHARAKAGSPGRLIVVEGYMDVIALTGAGIPESVAPMGTALTAQQLDMLWRVHPVPVLMFDGDNPGQKAALRACETALPQIGPGKSLKVAICPRGMDPDDIIRRGGGAAEIEAMCIEAQPMSDFLFDAVAASVPTSASHPRTPEDISGIWYSLETMAGHIVDDETRLQYSAAWRARFEREISVVARPVADLALMTYRQADNGDYLFPDTENEAEKRLIYVVQNLLKLRESERVAVHPIRETKKTVKAMAKTIGLDGPTLDAVCKMIEMDPNIREEKEMTLALYRRVLGIKGPMLDAMLSQALPAGVAPRSRVIKAAPRAGQALAWLDAGGIEA
jgi:DNA primase